MKGAQGWLHLTSSDTSSSHNTYLLDRGLTYLLKREQPKSPQYSSSTKSHHRVLVGVGAATTEKGGGGSQ